MNITVPPFASIQVIFKVRIGLGNFDQMLKGRGMERGPSEIGMDDNPCCIDHTPELWLGLTLKFLLEEGEEMIKREEGFINF